VALSVYALVRMTGFLFQISAIETSAFFAFFGTIVGYNFVKYDALARTQKLQMRLQLKAIAVLSFLSLLMAVYCFLWLEQITQLFALLFFGITLLYTLPFFPNRKNARNWAGIKIYIVALCWVGVTLFLPIINAEIPLTNYVILVAIQRFILIFVLILIFEIIDLKLDDPHLKTVPQQIGVKRTKIAGSLLMVCFVGFEFFNVNDNINCNFQFSSLLLKLILAIVVLVFLLFSNEKRTRYYSSFWAESIPILWWVLLLLFQ
jgi:hypothetical protein